MRAVIFEDIGKVRLATVKDPTLEAPTDALIKIRLAGICGSDLHPFHGRERGIDSGCVMGHEAVADVIAVGSAVTTLKVGDRVYVPFTTSCGHCAYCRMGLTCRCELDQLFGWVAGGRGLSGLQAELARVPMADATLVAVPESVGDIEALLLGDVMATGFFAADLAAVSPEGTYAVVGCGPIGLMAICGARERGAKHIFALDFAPERRAMAASFGAIPVDPMKEDAAGLISQVAGRGADAVMECVGSEAAARLAYDLVRPGGTLAVVGVHTAGFAFSPAEAYDKNLSYRTGRCPARAYAAKLLPLVAAERYPIAKVVSHTLALHEGARGYQIFDLKQDGCTKVVLRP